MKKWIVIFTLLLTSCKSEKEVLCDDPISTSGNLKVINRQCINFGEHPAAFLEVEDQVTHKHFVYTMNLIDGKIVMNLNTANAISISDAENAQATASMAVGMAAANAGGRR